MTHEPSGTSGTAGRWPVRWFARWGRTVGGLADLWVWCYFVDHEIMHEICGAATEFLLTYALQGREALVLRHHRQARQYTQRESLWVKAAANSVSQGALQQHIPIIG